MRLPHKGGRSANVLDKMRNRELQPRGAAFSKHSAREKFKNYRVNAVFDTHDPDGSSLKLQLPFLRKRSKIVEIVSAKDIVFGLSLSGVCCAFHSDTKQRICFLNITADEVIRSLFFNKANQSLITVSVYRCDNFSSLHCRTTPLEYIRRKKPEDGFPLFETESLRWPGFVEFDDVNGKVLTHSAEDKVYKVWDMTNYDLLYPIEDKNINEIKISPGIILLIYNRNSTHVVLKILSIEDGVVLSQFKHQLHKARKVDFIEQFNEKLLVKQENENLQIVDVRTSSVIEVARTEFMTPSAFIFLYENQLFLTFRNRCVTVWNFRGELVTKFDDHTLWHPDCNTNNIYITSQQDLIMSYCQSSGSIDRGTINISSILTGKCMSKISWDPSSAAGASTATALQDVTALFYNEERNEIYTGHKNGHISLWSN